MRRDPGKQRGRAAVGTRSKAALEPRAEEFMRLAVEEASLGLGRTSPNPAVGAVLVKGGKVVARGHHERAGGPHAEIVALRKAGRRAVGADLYTTLEPCNHQGRTPPCTEALIAAGVRRVFVGCRDLNPLVRGKGVQRLRAAGLEVVTGVLEPECVRLHEPFFTFITERRPFVTLKIASPADGKIATATGDSRWVTGPAARERVHALRNQVDAVLVGAGTVRADDPQLTARPEGKLSERQPLRVVLSSSLDISPKAQLFRQPGRTLVLTRSNDEAKAKALRAKGAEVVKLAGRRSQIDLQEALRYLASRDVVHLLVEGGAEVFGQFLEQRCADVVMLFIAPKVLGEGVSWARLVKRAQMQEAMGLTWASVEQVGSDLLVTGTLVKVG